MGFRLQSLATIIALLTSFSILTLSIPFTFAEEPVTHVVASGDTLFRIALRYGVSMDELAAANDIVDPTRIFSGQTLVIPGLSTPDVDTEVVENPLIAPTPIIHVVQRGETLGDIAQAYSTTVQQILDANNIANQNRILAGQELQIWTADATHNAEAIAIDIEATPIPEVVHVVQPGEYLAGIARSYGISWTLIAEANSITDPNRVEVGMELIIPSSAASAEIVSDLGIVVPPADAEPGAHWGVGRELVVDLSQQKAYAYEDGVLMHSAVVSTGLPGTPTVQGEYAIWHKTEEQTMSGPGYYLPGVKWVMYFYQGYGFHGTYWHDNFGQPMSHGCVNMTDSDAKWFYDFASLDTPVWVQA